MAVIKHQLAGAFVKDAIVLDMGDLRRQADNIVDAAKAQAQRIITDAKAKAVDILNAAEAEGKSRGLSQGQQQGLEKGRQAGHAEALAKAQTQLQQIQQGWLAAAQAWNDQRVLMDREAREAVMQMGLIFAEKVVQRVIQVDPLVIVDQLAEALSYVMRPTDVTVQINPADRPAIEEALPQMLAGLSQLEHVRLVDDATVSRGGCRIAYGQGRIDATVETQMERLVSLMIPSEDASGETAQAAVDPAADTGATLASEDLSANGTTPAGGE